MSESDLCCAATPDNSDYEADFLIWINTQVALLREKKFDQLDLDNLIEELDSMARRDKREIANRIQVLLTHLLKYRYQSSRRSKSWRNTIREQRTQIRSIVEDMPSVAQFIDGYISKRYPHARESAAEQTRIPVAFFPSANPFTSEQILDLNYFPEPLLNAGL
ncbi:DUF29 domain-containing protein [Oxalobacteraceae bacterium]|nr:DUF29 domain-containing protein [Oxalobacteraceae bacterium]